MIFIILRLFQRFELTAIVGYVPACCQPKFKNQLHTSYSYVVTLSIPLRTKEMSRSMV